MFANEVIEHAFFQSIFCVWWCRKRLAVHHKVRLTLRRCHVHKALATTSSGSSTDSQPKPVLHNREQSVTVPLKSRSRVVMLNLPCFTQSVLLDLSFVSPSCCREWSIPLLSGSCYYCEFIGYGKNHRGFSGSANALDEFITVSNFIDLLVKKMRDGVVLNSIRPAECG